MTEDDPFAFMRGDVLPARKTQAEVSRAAFNIFAFLDAEGDNPPSQAARELLGKAFEMSNQLGGYVSGYVSGLGAKEKAEKFQHFGLKRLAACSDRMGMADMINVFKEETQRAKPWLWLFSDSPRSRRLAARLAMRLEAGLVAGVIQTDLNLSEATIEFTHLELEGKMRRTLAMRAVRPQIATLVLGYSSPAVEDASETTDIEVLGG